MILDEYVKMIWHSTNKKFFVDKGYIFTYMGDELLIKVTDLKLGSHAIIQVKCDVCNRKKYISYKRYNKNIKSGKYYACSNKCAMNKNYMTNLEKYGTTNPNNLNELKERAKQRCLEKFGAITNLLCKDTRNKIKETNLKKYGVEHNSQSVEIKEKKKRTSFKKFGVEHPQQLDEIKEKTKQTNLKKFGTENPNELDEIKEKIKQINLKKYGVEYTSQSPIVREKIKQTNLKRYSVEYLHQNKIIAKKAQNTMIERYGEIWLKHTPSYNANSIIYLDMISEKLGIPIQHALNGGEKKFMRYWVDGYIEQYNIVLEWDEKFHNVKKFKTKDAIKETFLKENFNCYIIRINEKEFLSDIDNQINILCDKINTFINQITKTA